MLKKYKRKEDFRVGGSPTGNRCPPNYAPLFPVTKARDVTCLFCKHRFYIGKDLKGHNSPLLLPCGHCSCLTCESSKVKQPCPQCSDQEEAVNEESRKRLPVNCYVTGLLHAINSAPIHADDPDMSFHMPINTVARHYFDQGCCSECGMIANYNCKNCNVLFCKMCFKKFHGKALQNHEAVPLNKNEFQFQLNNFCHNHEPEAPVASEYYCEDCDAEFCSHCIIKSHNGHKAVPQFEKNQEMLPDFQAAVAKLKETRLRTHQTLQNLTKKMDCPEVLRESQMVEYNITQHFIQLHGILQNVEQQLKDQLYEQRGNLQREVEEFRSKLTVHEEKLTSATTVAFSVESNFDKVDLKKLTETLLALAESPCHILPQENCGKSIRMDIDNSALDSIKQHIQLHVPDVPRFKLVTTEQLPENYELEPLPDNETINSTFRLSTRKDISLPDISIVSGSTSPLSFDGSTVEPSAPMEKGNSHRVRVTYVNNPTDFYVQDVKNTQFLVDLETEIKNYYVNDDTKPPEEVFLNRVYIVYDSAVLKWYRGRIIKKHEILDGETTYDVFFIDYGITENGVTLDQIRAIRPEFNLQGGLAIHCTFSEIAPITGEWDENSLTIFKQHVANDILTMNILQINGSTYTVDLLKSTNTETPLSLHNFLIDSQLAKSTTFYKLKRMNPLSAQQFYYEDLPIKKYTYVKVSFIDSPSCMYVVKKNDKEFQDKMCIFHKQYQSLQRVQDLSLKNPEYGSTVAIKNNAHYERGIITQILHKESKVQVFLVDIGSKVTVDYSKVTHLANRFCAWNAQAIKISMIDIKPVDSDEWPKEVTAYLKTNLEGRTVKVVPFLKTEDNTYNACIYLRNDTNVNANLVSMNYAESTGDNSKHKSLNNDITMSKGLRKKLAKKAKLQNETQSELTKKASQKRKHVKKFEENDPFKVRVFVNKIVSPDAIYVSESVNVKIYEKMTAKIQEFYKSNVCTWERKLVTNTYYCVYSRKDKQFCRAQFLSMSESDPEKARMLLIDLAEEEDISLKQIQPLNSCFFEIPKYMFKVKLAGIRPCGGSNIWQSSSCQKLTDIITDTGETKYYITLVDSGDNNEVMSVDLFIRRNVVAGPTAPNRKETLSVARRLVEEGLALPIRGYFENDVKTLAVELKKKLYLDSKFYDSIDQNSDSNETVIKVDSTLDNSSIEIENDKENIGEDENEVLLDVSSESVPLPPKLSEWIPAAHVLEDTMNASITYVDYDGDAYFHPDTKQYNDTLEHINNTLNNHYSRRSIKKYDHYWEEGDLCIANYHFDKKWYRGVVKEVVNYQTVKVLFVDYGNVEECQIGSVKKRVILEHIPVQSIKASIVGIKPLGKRWKEPDLDIIHKLLVSNTCKIKITSKPPDPWKIAIWLIEGSSYYPLPWYLKNKTQVTCITEDICAFSDENGIPENPVQSIKRLENGFTTVQPLKFTVNGSDSSNLSREDEEDDEDDEDEEIFDIESDMDTMIYNSEKEYMDALDNSEDLAAEITAQMSRISLTTSIYNSFSSTHSKLSDTTLTKNLINGGNNSNDSSAHSNENEFHEIQNSLCNGIIEEMISSNSANDYHNYDYSFDTQSITSEVLYNDINDANLAASTPLNTSFQESESLVPLYIDFYKYKIRMFEMSIGEAFSETRMSGYIIKSPSEELNEWIGVYRKMQHKIQEYAENQPIFQLGSGLFCIAKYADGMWYRAVVLKQIGDIILIEFLDFGNRIKIGKNSLRQIKEEWLDIPCMSFHFKIYNVKVALGRKEEVQDALADVFAQATSYTVVIKKYDPVLELEIYLDEECKNLVYGPLIENNLLELIESEVD